jgi:TolB protein
VFRTCFCSAAALAVLLIGSPAARAGEGIFEGKGDIGMVLHPGSVEYDAANGAYRLTGSGENMWFAADAFHFVWKKVSGDVSITADITFPTTGGNAHKKAALLIRQSLEAGSAYADAALHGNGLTSLQFRETAAANTHEIQASVTGPRRLRLTKQGNYLYMSVAMPGEELHPAGGAMRIEINGPFYIGIGVCAHDKDAVESAVFRNVQIGPALSATAANNVYSTVETITVSSTDRRVAYFAPGSIEAPRWLPDNTLEFAQDRMGYRIPVDGGTPQPSENDRSAREAGEIRATSPDGKRVVFVSIMNPTRFNPAYQEATLQMMTVSDQKVTTLARLLAGPGTLSSAAWSPDGKRVTFVSYQMLP